MRINNHHNRCSDYDDHHHNTDAFENRYDIKMNNKLLTIGMATYDDYDGVYFTLQSLRMYHPVEIKMMGMGLWEALSKTT
jgi:hypothetical protein